MNNIDRLAKIQEYRDVLLRISVHQAALAMAIAKTMDEIDGHGIDETELRINLRYITNASNFIGNAIPDSIKGD